MRYGDVGEIRGISLTRNASRKHDSSGPENTAVKTIQVCHGDCVSRIARPLSCHLDSYDRVVQLRRWIPSALWRTVVLTMYSIVVWRLPSRPIAQTVYRLPCSPRAGDHVLAGLVCVHHYHPPLFDWTDRFPRESIPNCISSRCHPGCPRKLGSVCICCHVQRLSACHSSVPHPQVDSEVQKM